MRRAEHRLQAAQLASDVIAWFGVPAERFAGGLGKLVDAAWTATG
ncbi:hypothetical protein [Micromonospora chokoriensis]